MVSFATSRHYSAPERAALAFAEAMTITGQKVTDELFAEARRHYELISRGAGRSVRV